MTKKQFEKRVRTLLRCVTVEALHTSLALYSSGGVDPTRYKDDFVLPRICLTVALKGITKEACSRSSECQKEIKNLEHL